MDPFEKSVILSEMRRAVSGPTRISPSRAEDASRDARFVTEPDAVKVIRVPEVPVNLLIPTEAVPELIPMFTAMGSSS